MSGEPLIDNGDYPVITAYDVAEMHFLGANVRVIMFDWFKVCGVWQRRVTGAIQRPVSTMRPDLIKQWAHALVDPPPTEPMPIAVMH